MRPHKLGFLGAGNMAEALCRGLLKAEIFSESQMIASEPFEERRQAFQEAVGVDAIPQNDRVVTRSDRIVVSVKPQVLPKLLEEIGPLVEPDQLIISIVAGATLSTLEAAFPEGTRVVRTMPNTPMLVGLGVVGICRGQSATEKDAADVKRLMSSCAEVFQFEEDRMDAVTALSGSGPAYLFFLMEQMISAGEKMGMDPETATAMVRGTVRGAAELAASSDVDPAELRVRVTSPGGTTEAALNTLADRKVGSAVVDAILRAEARGKELGKGG